MHAFKDSMWRRILKNFEFLGGSKQGPRREGKGGSSMDCRSRGQIFWKIPTVKRRVGIGKSIAFSASSAEAQIFQVLNAAITWRKLNSTGRWARPRRCPAAEPIAFRRRVGVAPAPTALIRYAQQTSRPPWGAALFFRNLVLNPS